MFDGNLTIAAYTADLWDTACPILRFLGPAQQTSTTVIKGSVPRESGLQVQLEPIAEADIILIQREFPRHIAYYEQVMEEARRHGRPVVYELDDLLLELSPQHIDWSYYRTARLPLLKAIVEADAVTTSTPGLYDYLRQFNAHVWLLPNYLNDQLWTLRPAAVLPERIPLVIGYMGGHTHASDLELVAPALLRVLERHKGKVVLRFFGKAEPPPELIGRDDVSRDRLYFPDYAEFARYFSTQVCDIFIAPLRDNLFNRCKSAIKFLEYSSTGAPGVYSRTAPYEGVVNDQNGFLANASEEWEDALDQLINDPALRSSMGYRAQQTVQNRWLLSSHALDGIKHIAASSTGAKTRQKKRSPCR